MESHNNFDHLVKGDSKKELAFQRKTAEEAFKEFEIKYDVHNRWRLAVEGRLYDPNPPPSQYKSPKEAGWIDYETRETNSITGFLTAHFYSLQNKNLKLNSNFIKDLHRLATEGVHRMVLSPPGMYRQSHQPGEFGLEPNCVTQEGLTDLLNEIENKKLKSAFLIVNVMAERVVIDDKSISEIKNRYKIKDNQSLAAFLIDSQKKSNNLVKYYTPTFDAVDALNEAVIEHFNETLPKLKNDIEVLELIGSTIVAFERIHAFPDGNGRTYANLLLPFLMMQNGFPPPTFYESNVFDAYNYTAEVLLQGIENTLAIYAAHDKGISVNLFGYSDEDMNAQQFKGVKSKLVMDEFIEKAKIKLDEYNKIKSGELYDLKLAKNLFSINIVKADVKIEKKGLHFKLPPKKPRYLVDFEGKLKNCSSFHDVLKLVQENLKANAQLNEELLIRTFLETLNFDNNILKKENVFAIKTAIIEANDLPALKEKIDSILLQPLNQQRL